VFDTRTIVLKIHTETCSDEVKMSPAATVIVTPGSSVSSELDGPVSSAKIMPALVETVENDGLNIAWAQIVQSVTNGSGSAESRVITVDLAHDESAQDFSTRLRMLLLFMNRDNGSVSATVSPSFKNDTYPAMLALVKGFQSSGASEDWRPDGPRSIRMGNAKHLFVSVDMPVADRSPLPDTLIEIVAAHRISADWYDQRVAPRASSTGLTIVMFGVPNSPGSGYANSIFKRERTKNLSGRPGGIHFSRQADWSATAAV
jgi:hypothetical protein